jgi:hypothetical protein
MSHDVRDVPYGVIMEQKNKQLSNTLGQLLGYIANKHKQ